MSIRPERVDGHTGTEIRPRLLREAAAKNLPLRIFRNGRKPDGATPRERGRPKGCKVLLSGRNKSGRKCPDDDVNGRISPG